MIIYANNLDMLIETLSVRYDEICVYDFICALGLKIKNNDLIQLSQLNTVKYITSVSMVSNSIHIAKEVIHYDKIYNIKESDNKSIAIIDTGIFTHIDFVLGRNRIVKFVDLVNKKMEQLNKSLPEGLQISMMHDDSKFIRESMKEVFHTILLTALIVIVVIFVFLGDWRSTLIPFITIPVSLIGTFAALPIFGMSINLLTLFAMVLAVTVVVDDAIVVIENVKRHIEDGKNPIEATQLTMQEVGFALVAMAMVLMAVFVPVAFIGGLSGLMYRQFAVCIAVSIALYHTLCYNTAVK